MSDAASKSVGGTAETRACCVTDKSHKEIETDCNSHPPPTDAGAAAAVAAADSAALNLLPGEELTALTPDEMASVCRKLAEFARLNADRAGTTDDAQEEQK